MCNVQSQSFSCEIKNIQTTAVYCHWSHHSGLSGCEEKRNPAGKEIHPNLAVYMYVYVCLYELNYRNIPFKSLKCHLESWQFCGHVRNMTIMIVISLISFRWPLTVRPGSPFLSWTLDLLQTIVPQTGLYWNKDIFRR